MFGVCPGHIQIKRDNQICNGSFHLNEKTLGEKKGLGQLLGTEKTPVICRPKLPCWPPKSKLMSSEGWQAE